MSLFFSDSLKAQWKEQIIPYVPDNNAPIYAIHPVNDRDAWFITGEFRDLQKGFFKTENGGASYGRGIIASPVGSYDATRMSVFNRQMACVAYSGRSFNAQPSLVLRTTDGGVFWKNITPQSVSTFVSTAHFFNFWQGMVFSDDNANRKFVCYMTLNGGVTWNESSEMRLPARQNGEFSRSLSDFHNDNYWIYSVNFVTKTWRILQTKDKGASWQASKTTADNNFSPLSFKFCNNTEGVLIPFDFSLTKPLYRTSDGGMTWEPVKEDPTLARFFKQAVCHVKGTKQTFATAFLRNDSLFSAFTSNFGKSWYGWEFIHYERDQQGKDIAFSSTSKGWVLGGASGAKVFHWNGNIKSYPDFIENELNGQAERVEAGIVGNNGIGLSVFPNPATDKMNIVCHKNDYLESISISDMYGRRVYESQFIGDSNFSLDCRHFSDGVYFIEIKTDKTIQTRKIMIQK